MRPASRVIAKNSLPLLKVPLNNVGSLGQEWTIDCFGVKVVPTILDCRATKAQGEERQDSEERGLHF